MARITDAVLRGLSIQPHRLSNVLSDAPPVAKTESGIEHRGPVLRIQSERDREILKRLVKQSLPALVIQQRFAARKEA